MRAWLLLLVACGRVHFDTSAPIDPTEIESNLVFLTTTQPVAGQLGGVANADAICASEAAVAGLPGTYVAFLSTATTPAIARIGNARGWTRPDGAPFVDTPQDLVAGRIYSALTTLADGTQASSSLEATTGSDRAGQIGATNRCSEYMQSSGAHEYGRAAAASNSLIHFSASGSCTFSTRLYCFGIDRSVAVAPPATNAGRRAFLSTPWTPAGGLAGADAHCQSDATATGLAGEYVALLSTSTSAAGSRFAMTGTRWIRVDGMIVADTPDRLLGHISRGQHPLNVTADGQYVGGTANAVFTGARFPDEGSIETCNDWTLATANATARIGRFDYVGQDWFDGGTQTCDKPGRLYCLQR